MAKIAEKVWISKNGRSLIFQMGIRKHPWIVWPALIIFPRGSGDGLGGGTPARDMPGITRCM